MFMSFLSGAPTSGHWWGAPWWGAWGLGPLEPALGRGLLESFEARDRRAPLSPVPPSARPCIAPESFQLLESYDSK